MTQSLINFKRYLGQQLPDRLLKDGPQLSVIVFLPQSVIQLRGAPQQVTVKALIDTGASGTCISKNIAAQLSLKPIQQVSSVGAHGGIVPSNLYSIDFTFDGSGIFLRNWQVMEVDLIGQGFDILIGRDVLSNVLFVYDGSTGGIGLEFPSTTHPLSNPPWIQTAKAPSPDFGQRKEFEKRRKMKRKAERRARKRNRRR